MTIHCAGLRLLAKGQLWAGFAGTTLINASADDCKVFEEMLGTIFHIPHGQGIVTTSRTSSNEAFNREKLVFLDKKVDFWKTYSAHHACAVISHTCGLVNMLTMVWSSCAAEGFSAKDLHNLERVEALIKAKQQAKQQAITSRNLSRHVHFEQQQQDAGWWLRFGKQKSGSVYPIITYLLFLGTCLLQSHHTREDEHC